MADQKKQSYGFDSIFRNFLKQYNFATKQDIDKLIQRIDRLEKNIISDRMDRKVAGANENAQKNMPASDLVIDVIAGIGTGANFAEIQKKTQFEDKKLRNIIYRLTKQGKIVRKKRGVYLPA